VVTISASAIDVDHRFGLVAELTASEIVDRVDDSIGTRFDYSIRIGRHKDEISAIVDVDENYPVTCLV